MSVPDTMRRVHAVNPEALMFGTDLPGTRAGRPFQDSDVDLISDVVGTDMFPFWRTTPARSTASPPGSVRLPTDPTPTLPILHAEQPTLSTHRDALPELEAQNHPRCPSSSSGLDASGLGDDCADYPDAGWRVGRRAVR